MQYYLSFLQTVALLPDWVALFLPVGLLLLCALALYFCKKKEWYAYACVACGGVGFALMCCEVEVRYAFVWLGLFALFSALCSLLFLLPYPKKRKRVSREERIYEKFHLPLLPEEEKGVPVERSGLPPKVCCFEEGEVLVGAEESGLRFEHVFLMLSKLRTAKLSAGDRLETDVLLHSIESFRQKRLTAEEVQMLNDCLASVLKLCAKYNV